LCSIVFFELLPENFSIERPIVGFNVLESSSLSIIPHTSFNVSIELKANLLHVLLNELLDPIVDHISLTAVSMNNCALLDYTPPPW
jgi:hypothetical protein